LATYIAGVDFDSIPPQYERFSQGVDHRCDLRIDIRAICVGHKHAEFVTAQTGDHRLGWQRMSESRRKLAQLHVAMIVTQRVVDLLEPVEVKDQQSRMRSSARCACDGQIHLVAEHGAVRKIGETVVARLVGERRFGAFATSSNW
jgi:hypothetical protein